MQKPGKCRLDVALVARGLCESREQARRLILAGEVSINDRMIDKPAAAVADEDRIDLKVKPRYVSRGGLKLESALLTFGIDPEGWTCLDVGASTGGFTDCLLQYGAARVYAFDVGTNQLAWKLRSDPRVVSREQFNVRHLQPADIEEPIDLAVFDVSFISLTLVLPPVIKTLRHPGGRMICLIKPQFELGREDVGKGGIVRDPALHQRAIDKIRLFVEEHTLLCWQGVMESPIKGTDGNTEFLAWISQPPSESLPT